MLFQPPILALLLADGLALLMLLPTGIFAVQLLRNWDPNSGRARQIRLERGTYLAATIFGLVLLMQVVALLLFVFAADRLSVQFVGAMCAIGTLNVNVWGFPALLLRIALFFLAAIWLLINHLDNRAPDYPLTRAKYGFLILIIPVAIATAGLHFAWFQGLDPDVITSCCGSLFSLDSKVVTADLAGLPPLPTMIGFYSILGFAVATGAFYYIYNRGLTLFVLFSAIAFPATLTAVIAFISPYLYEHPHHHCPFCLLKAEYDYAGYALYLPLFGATALALGLGVAALLARTESAKAVLTAAAPRLVLTASLLFGLLMLVSAAISLRSHLNLLGV